MRRGAGVLVLLILVSALASAQGTTMVASKPSATSARSPASDQQAIAALWKEYSRTEMSNDLAGWLAIHEPDAYKMPPDKPMFQISAAGEALKAKWAKRAEGYTMEMRVDPKEIAVFGDHAYTMGTYYVAATPKAGGDPVITDGKFLTVLDKGADGKWRILRDCYNSNIPPKK